MKINLAKNEYRALLDVFFLADWILHAYELEKSSATEKYRALEQKIFSWAKDFGFEHLVEYDDNLRQYFPTKEFEEKSIVLEAIDDYDNETFWDELIDRLAVRDLIRQLGQEAVTALEPKERLEKLGPLLERYGKEFERHGLERLSVPE